MKVLLIHNYLRPPSGENSVFDSEKALLRSDKTDVVTCERNNSEVEKKSIFQKLFIPAEVWWSQASYNEVTGIIRKERPVVAHFHNTFPLISPSAYYACRDAGVPVVQTLHNHRLFCPGGYLLKNGAICTDCIQKSLWQSVRNGCYHDSSLQTAWVAGMLYFHRLIGTWNTKIDCFITLTQFAKKLYSNAGLPGDRIEVKPNFVPDYSAFGKKSEGYGVFVGRLGAEKGVEFLLYALKRAGDLPFKIVGDGPLRTALEELKHELNLSRLEFCGYRDRNQTLSIIGRSSYLVLPAIWYEGFPMVIVEAMSVGKPVISTDLGGVPEIIRDRENGFVVPPGDTDSLAARLGLLSTDSILAEILGEQARQDYEQFYTPEKNYEMLVNIYDRVLKRGADEACDTGDARHSRALWRV